MTEARIEYLELDDVLAAATAALGHAPEVRDWGLLDAALGRARSTVYGEDAYPGLHDKAAVLLESLARNHALVDGNERLAWVATRLFYVFNRCDLVAARDIDAAEAFVHAVAAGRMHIPDIAATLAAWVVSLETDRG